MTTSGIYKFTFKNGAFYIGKSIDIPRRWEEHRKKMQSGKAASAVQRCYMAYGMPKFQVLQECHPDHIDLMETVWIYYQKPGLNSAGTVKLTLEEMEYLDNNAGLLKHSTVEHIQMLLALNTTVDDLRLQYDMKGTPEHFAELERLNDVAYSEARYWQDRYREEKQVTWWQRLWR